MQSKAIQLHKSSNNILIVGFKLNIRSSYIVMAKVMDFLESDTTSDEKHKNCLYIHEVEIRTERVKSWH